jgi:hypothetical protein
LVLIFGWQLIFSAFALYQSKRLLGLKKEIIDLLKATTLSALLLYLSAWLFDMSLITPIFSINILGLGQYGLHFKPVHFKAFSRMAPA